MKRFCSFTLGALALVSASAMAEEIKRIQYPAISPDGATILFSWQSDIWSVPRTGGKAVRLTVHSAPDSRPVWFPDGSRFAFSSSRYGSIDVFTLKPDGTDLRRVTYDSSSELPSAVSPDGRFIYGSTSLWSRGDIFRVPVAGGDLQRLTSHPFEASFAPSLSQDGSKVYYNRGAYRETAWQKMGMVSSALPEIWVADNTVPLSNHKRLTNNENTDLFPIPQADGSIIAVTNRGGAPNIWRLLKGETPLTKHVNGSSRNPSTSRDGRYVAYEFESELQVLDTVSGQTSEVKVEVPADDRINPVQEVTVSSGITEFAVSPDGKRILAAARGDVFLLPEKGGTTRRVVGNTGRDYGVTWLDAKTGLYTTMEKGLRRIKQVDLDGDSKDFLVDSTTDLMSPVVSPDGKMVAFHKGSTELCVADNEGKGTRTLLKANFTDAYEGAALVSWSPDSAYLAVSIIQGRRTLVSIIEVKSGKVTTVAKMVNRPQRGSVSVPQFTGNGRSLFFISPEYDNSDLYVVDLVPADVTFTEDDLDKIDDTSKKDKPAVEVKVYEPNLESRLRRLTTAGCNGAVPAADGKSIIALTDAGLAQINPATGSASTLIAAATPGFRVQSGFVSGGKLYVLNGGTMASVNVAGVSSSLVPIAMSASYTVNAKAEERALFEEIWWTLDGQYYDPKMNGKDWKAIKTKYATLVPFAYDRTDFYRMMGEMMEELESSHLGATAPPADFPGSGTESTAFLGIDLDPAALSRDGSAVVGKVIANSPADHPAMMLKVGDKIVEVDGEKVAGSSFAQLLNKKSSRKVALRVERDGKFETVTIKPASSALRSSLDYDNYVNETRARVEKLSEGKLGYVHIRAMDKPSLDQFLREIRTQGEGRKGLIIDVRFNGGGSTAVDVLNTLIRSPWLIRTTRGEFGLKLSENVYRSDALELPTALMCNTFSFSNAEVITEGFRKLRLGPIIGERTPGYVIGTGAASLWDGGTIRMPVIGAYAVNGENLENGGRRPDHTVWFDPNAWMEGRDLQIERAVVELLKSAK
ncbi:MAG: S41 family peptidase [Armatimonadota bacterium]